MLYVQWKIIIIYIELNFILVIRVMFWIKWNSLNWQLLKKTLAGKKWRKKKILWLCGSMNHHFEWNEHTHTHLHTQTDIKKVHLGEQINLIFQQIKKNWNQEKKISVLAWMLIFFSCLIQPAILPDIWP